MADYFHADSAEVMNSEPVKRDWWRFACYFPGAVLFIVQGVVRIVDGRYLTGGYFVFVGLAYATVLVVFCDSFRRLLAVLWRSLRGEC